MSFFRDRSPVTPKITRAQGSGMRGSLRSCAVRSGLPTWSILPVLGVVQVKYAGARPMVERTPVGESDAGAGLKGLLHALEQFLPADLELVDALVLEDLDHVVEVDPDRLEVGHHLVRLRVRAGDGVAADLAVVGEGVDHRFRHGVDR